MQKQIEKLPVGAAHHTRQTFGKWVKNEQVGIQTLHPNLISEIKL